MKGICAAEWKTLPLGPLICHLSFQTALYGPEKSPRQERGPASRPWRFSARTFRLSFSLLLSADLGDCRRRGGPRRVPSLLWTVLLVSAAAGSRPWGWRVRAISPRLAGWGARRGRGLRSPFAARPLIAPDLRAFPRPPGESQHFTLNPTPVPPPPPLPPPGRGEEKDT